MALQGEEYKLMWKPTVDFVRMASRLNAIIVPFGILGADEAYVQIDTLLGHHFVVKWGKLFSSLSASRYGFWTENVPLSGGCGWDGWSVDMLGNVCLQI
jgi:hypothetical protein